MSDITDAVTDRVITNSSMDGDAARAERRRFAPNYTPLAGSVILRCRLYADEGGVATATFAGTLEQQALWLEAGGSGRLSVYAEVTREPEGAKPLQTTLRTRSCQRARGLPEDARRIGSVRGEHAHLLGATVGAPEVEMVLDDTVPQPSALAD